MLRACIKDNVLSKQRALQCGHFWRMDVYIEHNCI